MKRTWMLIACGFAACNGDANDAQTMDTHASEQGVDAEADDDFKGCPEDVPAFGPGLRAESDHFAAKLLGAMPAEPERYSNNRWSVELSARDGSSVPGATITHGQTFMPIHGHDGRVEPRMTALSSPGQFQVDDLNFTMRGPWEVRLWLRAPAIAEELVVFQVCVAK